MMTTTLMKTRDEFSNPCNLLPLMNGIEISCDKPCYDGRMASNLINIGFGSQGFMAERFVRPPVSLTVKFPCPIRLKAILIGNTLGSFTSDSFEILSYSLPLNKEPCQYPVYKPIGRCYNVEPGDVAFINNSTLLNSARYLLIRITHTLNGAIPVMNFLQIIGTPHSQDFLRPLSTVPSLSPTKTLNSLESKEAQTCPLLTSQEEDAIPKDFLDPLTYEIMSLPVILPSGHTVDQKTLDKYIAREQSCGRNPSDPFTSVPFTESSYPLVNSLLKERIDRYTLTKNITVGKTTGSKKRKLGDEETVDDSKHDVNQSNIAEVKNSERLAKVLAKTASFRTIGLPKIIQERCQKCSKANDSDDTIFYKLSCCQKLLCKDCVHSMKDSIFCNECKRNVSMSTIIRYHKLKL